MSDLIQRQMELVWAKSNREQPEQIHLLIYHLLESAAVGLGMWNHVFSASIRQEYSSLFRLKEGIFGKLLAYWIGLHDIGKASPCFQIKIKASNPERIRQIQETNLKFGFDMQNIYHSRVSGKYLKEHQLVPKEVETAITGHHGTWDTGYRGCLLDSYGDAVWDDLRGAYCEILRTVIGIEHNEVKEIDSVEQSNLFTVWLSGVISVADWIASDESCFDYHSEWIDPFTFFERACQRAEVQLRRLGWMGWKALGGQHSFADMYRFKGWDGPRPIQSDAIKAYEAFAPDEPFLMIVEAPTGIGKTEIAMYLADQWLQDQNGSGMYIAMPTQATSNQLFERSKQVLEHRYADQIVQLVLAHGQARWNEAVNHIGVREVGDEESQGVIAAEWFQNNRKRTLLAPFGVGTVDQVFLSILQTKHFFVRLFGLKNKVLIFDEVHAYDTYMNTLFHRLLEWLHGLRVSVIILSATLPEQTRKEITAHYTGMPMDTIGEDYGYPRVTMASEKHTPVVTPLKWMGDDRQIRLHWEDRENLCECLGERLSGGGCAAVICNTVGQAQGIFQQLQDSRLVEEEDLILFHARFPFGWRKKIEDKVLERFGQGATLENGIRPKKAIVVATQVIEQSLDLDFDFMITELAPVDLILQRAGRLHRHDRSSRPRLLREPKLIILKPEADSEGVPDFGKREPFYQKSILAKTYYQLLSTNQIQVISNTRKLIEAVYQDDKNVGLLPEIFINKIAEWIEIELNEELIKADTAGFTTIDSPDNKRLLRRAKKQLNDDEHPGVVEHIRAKTRDGGVSIRVSCLFSNNEGEYYFDLECKDAMYTGGNLAYLRKRLSENEININNIGLIRTIQAESFDIHDIAPELPQQKVLIFSNGEANIGKYVLTLTKELGLQYKYGGENG